jgi:SRSO17 transposase
LLGARRLQECAVEVKEFDRVHAAFLAFHAEFAPHLGRKQWRQRTLDYWRGLLVQSEERRNAENVAEAVAVPARSLQRVLTDARWDDAAVIAHLQAYLAPRLNHPDAVWAVDESGFPKQGKRSAGVARQYCGAVGKVANCQIGVFLAHVGPRGRALVDKRLWLPQAWTEDPARCQAAGVPEEARPYRSKTELALTLLRRAKALGQLVADWVTGDDAYGSSPDFRDGVAAEDLVFVLEVPSTTPVWPLATAWDRPTSSGFGRPRKSRPAPGQRREARERAAALGSPAWRAVWVAEGAQGPRVYRFAAERVRDRRDGEPGEVVWLVHRENLDGREPRTYFSNAPELTPLATLARVAAARWPVETELETNKSDLGLDEYEVRSWHGWNHHITLCLLASAFLLTLQQEWGEKDPPDHPPPGLPGGARGLAAAALLPRATAGVAAGYPTAQ